MLATPESASVAANETLTGPPYQPLEHVVPPQATEEVGAWVSFLITCATVFTVTPLVGSQSRRALNSVGLIAGAGVSPPQLSQMRWKKKITQPGFGEASACACWM